MLNVPKELRPHKIWHFFRCNNKKSLFGQLKNVFFFLAQGKLWVYVLHKYIRSQPTPPGVAVWLLSYWGALPTPLPTPIMVLTSSGFAPAPGIFWPTSKGVFWIWCVWGCFISFQCPLGDHTPHPTYRDHQGPVQPQHKVPYGAEPPYWQFLPNISPQGSLNLSKITPWRPFKGI